jgi:hypothetical protein
MRWSVPGTMVRLMTLSGLALTSHIASAQGVVTYHNAPDRHGGYVVPGLTQTAAANIHPDAAFRATVSGNVYAQPLYWQPSGAKVGLLIVATESNLVYALNANTGAQVWKTQLATAVPNPPPHSLLGCGNIDPEGVTGTPVIDPASGRLYLDATTLQPGNLPRHMIYAPRFRAAVRQARSAAEYGRKAAPQAMGLRCSSPAGTRRPGTTGATERR